METKMTPEQKAYYERTRRPLLRVPTSRIGRLGCGVLVILWFVLLLTPCGLFFLATSNEIRIELPNVPDPQEHPLFSLGLVMDEFNRGIKMTRSQITSVSVQSLCVQTNVNYWRWQSDGTSDTLVFCQCYEKQGEAWVFTTQSLDACVVN